jgi:cyanophycinase
MTTPKGTLIIIGGAEDKGEAGKLSMEEKNREFHRFEILEQLLPKRKNSDATIEIITTASKVPREVGEDYQKAFKKLGLKNIHIMNICNREEAREEALVNRIRKAHTVLFSGGDQFRLSTILGSSPVVEEIMSRYAEDEDFTIAGTSAGAMVMSKIMIYQGQGGEAMLKGCIKTAAGLGFLDHCIVDTHFIKRGRFGRLAQAIIENPTCIGIGLGEDTALLVKKGNIMECKGSGMVMILDGNEVKHTNIAYAEDETPLCVEHMIVHVLARGNAYRLKEKKFIPEKEDLLQENTMSAQTEK